MIQYLSIFLIILTLFACQSEKKNDYSEFHQHLKEGNDILNNRKAFEAAKMKQKKDSTFLLYNLVDIHSVDTSIQVDVKYASADNFMQQKLYQHIDAIYLQKDVAERIAKCQSYLKKLHPKYSLLIYDAVRPVSVQQKMWDALDSIPEGERGKFVSNPKNHSVHNYGAAVDITIVDEAGKPLDMGAGYDDIRKIAYPSLEAQFLASGELTQQQVDNRKLLRKVMQSQHFRNIPSEWWHFNAFSRDEVKRRYKVVLEEPIVKP